MGHGRPVHDVDNCDQSSGSGRRLRQVAAGPTAANWSHANQREAFPFSVRVWEYFAEFLGLLPEQALRSARRSSACPSRRLLVARARLDLALVVAVRVERHLPRGGSIAAAAHEHVE